MSASARILSPLLGSKCLYLETKLEEQFLWESKRGLLSGREREREGKQGRKSHREEAEKQRCSEGKPINNIYARLDKPSSHFWLMWQKNNLPLFLSTIYLTSWHRRGVILQSLSWRKCGGGEKSTTSHLYWETRELLPAVSYVCCAPSDRPLMQPQISALCTKDTACLTQEDQTDLEWCLGGSSGFLSSRMVSNYWKPWNFVQTVLFPRGRILLTLIISPSAGHCFHLSWETS